MPESNAPYLCDFDQKDFLAEGVSVLSCKIPTVFFISMIDGLIL